MPGVTKRASEINLRRKSKSSLNQRRRLKAAASSERINDENNGELATGSNAKKSKLNGGRRALLEIAWWTVTPNLSDYLENNNNNASNSYILYSSGSSPSDNNNIDNQQPTKGGLAPPRPTPSRMSSMR
ncbi:hypothetical protein E3Q06_02093 [Wallemia mellicola]|nr:hypothetical protein E3Q21_02104 [Wallemia mellicola]TIB88235.1 hypothetical protein E3Q20_02097 [Wallemia mellicola]TIC40371.1 hypothetical protein E3Q07_02172 [Wallemia mellicola]TIC48924.1 hypothetical protein E3Q06_02093 [Wallemia mellicola]